jgi:hypothetical protein
MRLSPRSTSATFGVIFASALAGLGAAVGAAGCNKELGGPEAEVKPHNTKLDLPAVPSFDLPPAGSDGSHSVKEMRVKGRKFLDSEVTIKGYVTWVYDCATAIRTPEMSDKDVQKLIAEDPTKCRRPVFYIGDSADTPGERSAWVVEVPRELRDDEKKALTKEDKANLPPVPPYKVGDEVLVTGDWKLSSAHGEMRSDGLLVYKTMKNITQNWEGPAASTVQTPPTEIKPPPH